MCQLWHGIFIFFCGCQPKKQGASYGMSISKPYCFLGGAHPKNRCQLWHWNYKALLLFGGLPKKWCQLWHGTCLIFIWGASQKKVAIFGMESSPKNVPVMACFCPLFIFIWWFPPKNVCQLWHGNLFPYIYLGVDPFTYLCLGFYPQQPQPKTHLPTHPFFPKKHSCSCSSSWSKKWSLCRPGLPSTAAKAPWP